MEALPPPTDAAAPDFGALLDIVALVLARVLPLAVLTPIFGGNGVPARVKFALAAALAAGIAPFAAEQSTGPALWFWAALVKEALVGLLLALVVLSIFEATRAAGEVIDLVRGATIGNYVNPLTRDPSESVLAPLLATGTLAAFASAGGMAIVVGAVAATYGACGPFDLGPFGAGGTELVSATLLRSAVFIATFLVTSAVALAAPVIVTLLLVEVATAVFGSLASEQSAGALGMQLRGIGGVLVLALFVVASLSGFLGDIAQVLQGLNGILFGA